MSSEPGAGQAFEFAEKRFELSIFPVPIVSRALALHWRLGDQPIGTDIIEIDALALGVLGKRAEEYARYEVLLLVIRHSATLGASQAS